MKKRSSQTPSSKKKKKSSPASFLFIALFLLVAALVLLRFSGIGAAPGSSTFKQMLGSTQLMQNAKLVKQDLKDIAYQMKDNDIVQLEYSSRKLDTDVAVLKEYISTPVWTVAEIVPVLGQDVKTAKALVEISEVFSDDLLKSWIDLQKKAPYTEIKTEAGYNDEMIELYLAYLGDNIGTVKSMVDRLDKLNLRLIDESGKITSALKTASPLINFAYDHYDDAIKPGVEFLLAHHPSEIKNEEGFNLEMIGQYYEFGTQNLAVAKTAVAELKGIDLSVVDKDGKLKSYLELADPMLAIFEQYSDKLIGPGLSMLSEHPLSGLKTDEGIQFDEIGLWSDFLHDHGSEAESMIRELRKVDFSPSGKQEKIDAYLTAGEELLSLGIPANEELLRPGLELLEKYPFSVIKNDIGYEVGVILEYLKFAEEKLPAVMQLADDLQTTDLSLIDRDGKIEKYVGKFAEIKELLKDFDKYVAAARVILGDGAEDRFYVFPAQNSAEIRASGGFPGNVTTIMVHNGTLSIGEFMSGYTAFTGNTPGRAKITAQELRIFTARMYAPIDVDFCIDYERVASIWAMAFNDRVKIKPDGVITATPIVVQKILSVFDEPIVLSDGTALDGVNASKFLQRDIYFEYKRAGMNVNPDVDMTDVLFYETVKKTLDLISSHMDPGTILDLFKVFLECTEERIVMIWMADPEEQEVMREVGWSGALNYDPEDPKLGIYFSSEQSGKMGYFFDMIPEIGEPVVNEDGSCTYDVTLTLNNIITKEEQRIGGTWILGRYYVGNVVGDLTLTAPAGGKITDTSLNIARGMRQETYQGLDTHYIQWLNIERQTPVIVRFKVTTAPGVDAPLGISATPTLTKYRPEQNNTIH